MRSTDFSGKSRSFSMQSPTIISFIGKLAATASCSLRGPGNDLSPFGLCLPGDPRCWFANDIHRHSPDDIQIRGNRTTAPSPQHGGVTGSSCTSGSGFIHQQRGDSANILHRTAKTCTSTPSAYDFLPPRQLLAIAPSSWSWILSYSGQPSAENNTRSWRKLR